MQAVFLAGGRGSRLKGLTSKIPKPMLDVQGTPCIEHGINRAKKAGIDNILILTGYLAHAFDYLPYEKIKEEEPLGTGGSLLNAAKQGRLKNTFFLFNADTIFNADYLELMLASPELIGVVGTTTHNGAEIPAGVYYMHSDIISDIPEGYSSLEHDVLPKLREEELVMDYHMNGEFIDIGTPENYKKAQRLKWIIQK